MRYEITILILTLTALYLSSCTVNYKKEIEIDLELVLGESFNIEEVESLDAIGEGGFVIKFKLLRQEDLSDVIQQILQKPNYYSKHPISSDERSYWYKKGDLFLYEEQYQSSFVSFSLNQVDGRGTYSDFDD